MVTLQAQIGHFELETAIAASVVGAALAHGGYVIQILYSGQDWPGGHLNWGRVLNLECSGWLLPALLQKFHSFYHALQMLSW